MSTREQADIEVSVRMIIVNYGRNKDQMNACKPLAEYSWFINEIRKRQEQGHNLEVSVESALTAMPQDNLIKDFLMLHKQEVQGMLDTEYNEAEVMEMFREDGKKEGENKLLIEQICKKLAKGKSVEVIADEVEESADRVQKICDVIGEISPDYNVDKIYEAMRK